MEIPTKTPYLDQIGKRFGILAAQTDFVSRYYDLCQRHSVIDPKLFSCKKEDVVKILSELGQTPKWDARDKSYSFDYNSDGWAILRGFFISKGTVEFWFSGTRGTERVGSNLASIARGVTEAIDPAKIPNPPFPRPFCKSHDELREVLRHCFELCQVLFTVLVRIPKP